MVTMTFELEIKGVKMLIVVNNPVKYCDARTDCKPRQTLRYRDQGVLYIVKKLYATICLLALVGGPICFTFKKADLDVFWFDKL